LSNDKKIKISDSKASKIAKKILDEMPKWQREYADSIIEAALSDEGIYPPPMFGRK